VIFGAHDIIQKETAMLRRILVWTGLLVIAAGAPASAQVRVEISPFVGWVFSDGVSGDATLSPADGQIYDRIDPKDAFNFGFSVGVLATDNAEVGFIYARQNSQLVIAGTSEREIGDLAVTTYHGYFGYNWGDPDAPVRPFFFGGLGATHFGEVTGTIVGETRTIGSETQFSTTWGAGVKIFPAPNFGLRIGAHWTPTYIKTDAGGWWCDPWYGCYLVGNSQYSHQWQLNGGVTIRF
jgi:opacity protein-like surface antigen